MSSTNSKDVKRKKCEIDNCNSDIFCKNLCKRHYVQMQVHGKILERTRFDLNEIIKYDDYAEIVLYDRQCNETAHTKIDLDDIEECNKYKWSLSNDGYVTNNKVGKLHRFIIDVPKKLVVDHINWDKLDNRKSNLKICTQHENTNNRNPKSTNKTGISFISWCNHKNKWRVRIKKKHLGYFDNLENAIKVRNGNIDSKYIYKLEKPI